MNPCSQRRQRLHDLLLALIAQEEDLPLLDSEHPHVEEAWPRAAGWIRIAERCSVTRRW